jgi:hypothetical protein
MASSANSAADAAVKTLLETANLAVSDEEFTKFTESYPILRGQADGLYLPHLDAEEPAVSFDPTAE